MPEEKNRAAVSVAAYTRSFFQSIRMAEDAKRIYDELRNLRETIEEGEERREQGEDIAIQRFVDFIPFLSTKTVDFLAGLGEDIGLPDILSAIEEFSTLYERIRRPVNMILTSAVPLTEEQRDRIIKGARSRMGNPHFFITDVVDESLIGGVKLESENYYYDNTIRKKLQGISEHLLESQ